MLVIVKSLACFFLASFCLFAQLDLGSIDGTVTDTSGAVVAGAKMQIKNPDTDFTQELVTNAQGLYSSPLLRPGNYQLIVEAPGFRRAVRNGIVLITEWPLNGRDWLRLGGSRPAQFLPTMARESN
jgi:Carboxypeptidase regulatory-like domain